MRPSIQPTIFPRVISEKDVTGDLPDYCALPVKYARAREVIMEEGKMLVQRYSNYLFFIELYEMYLDKDLKTAYAINDTSFFLFFMFDGNLTSLAGDGTDVASANKGIWYANYKKEGSTFINSIAPGTHRFCYITPRFEWFERKAGEFPEIGKFFQGVKSSGLEYGYMPRCQIDFKIYRQILNLFSLQNNKAEDIEALILNQVVQLIRLYNDTVADGAFIRSEALKERIRVVRQYIDENSRDLKIGDIQYIADKFFFARRTLTRAFKNETGFTVQEYIEKSKLENALKLLKETKLSIREISNRAGYPDQNYFSRVMRKQFATSPKNVRLFLSLNGASFSTIWP